MLTSTVLAFHQGNRTHVFCNDDAMPPFVEGCRLNAVLGHNNFLALPGGERVSSGSGVRTLVVDGYNTRPASRGFFDLFVFVPPN